MTNKKWLSLRGTGTDLEVIEEKDDEWGSVTTKKTEFVESPTGDYYKITITYEMNGIWEQLKERKGQKFVQIEIPNGGLMLDMPGSPQIPQEGLLIALPHNAEVIDISITESQFKTHRIENELIPIPKPTRDIPLELTKNKTYDLDEFFPGHLFKDIGLQKIGDIKALQLIVYPVQYNPISRQLRIYSKIIFEIKYKKKKSRFRGGLRSGVEKPRRKRIPQIYKDSLLNLENI
ncbi:MAG: C25 family peptidase propeptide domain-containing protein [Candidatus Helarchaeota archaeon]